MMGDEEGRQMRHEILRAHGILDGRTEESRELHEILARARKQADTAFVLDLSKVTYINSSTLGELIRFLSAIEPQGGRLLLMSAPRSVSNVLKMTGLSELMPLLETEEELDRALGVPAKKRVAEDVDYEQLTEEIEDIILGEDTEKLAQHRETGQLRKLLG
jgi:anti-sigma B factor antagonist